MARQTGSELASGAVLEGPARAILIGGGAARLVILACIAVGHHGMPTADTLWIAALLWVLAGVAQRSHGYFSSARFMFAASGVALLAGLILAGGFELQVQRVQACWMFLVVIPLAVFASHPGFVPLHSAPTYSQGLLLGSVLFGLAESDPWQSPRGMLLLWALVGSWIALAAHHQYCQARLRASPRLASKGGAALVGPAHAGRSTLRVALLATALAALLFQSVDVGRKLLHKEPAPPRPQVRAPESNPAGFSLGIPIDPRSLGDQTEVARVGVLMTPGHELPSRLYLRQYYLDQPRELDGCIVMGRRSPVSYAIRDDTDGSDDGHVRLQPALDFGFEVDDPTPPAGPSHLEELAEGAWLIQRVTLLASNFTRLMAQPQAVWLDVEEQSVGRDGSLFRIEGQSTYTVSSRADLYLEATRISDLNRASPDRWMPEDYPERDWITRRVQHMVGDYEVPLARARRLERIFKRESVYDVQAVWPGSYREFFEGKREGLCVHFAQLFAVMARVAGLPSRVAVGYLAQEFDAQRQEFVVRARNYHAWCEIEFTDGWVVFDPTPPRTDDEGDDEPELAEDIASAGAGEDPEDAASNSPPWGNPLLWFALLLAVVAMFAWMPRRTRVSRSPSAPKGAGSSAQRTWRYWQKFLDLCERARIPKAPGKTASEFASEVAVRIPEERSALMDFVAVYHHCRFGGGPLEPGRDTEIRAFLKRISRRRAELADASGVSVDVEPGVADEGGQSDSGLGSELDGQGRGC